VRYADDRCFEALRDEPRRRRRSCFDQEFPAMAAQEDDVGSVQRQAEVDAMIQRYAEGEGRGRDIAYLRRWAQDVRRRRGPNAIFTKVEITQPTPHRTVYTVWYRYPKDKKAAKPETVANVTDIPTVSRTTPTSSKRPDNGLNALSRSAAEVPKSSVEHSIPGGALADDATAGGTSTAPGEAWG
jgi:hypothetical protein